MTTISNQVRYYHSGMANAPVLSGTAGALISVLDACLVDGWDVRTINTLTVTDGIAVATISAGHSYGEGDVIRVAGATPAKLNSDWRLASVTASTVTFSVEGVGIPDGAATGTITALRAPARWQKVFADGTTRAAYRSLDYAAHNGLILYVDDTGTTTARARGYESMTDIDTGAGPFPTDAQISGGYWWAKSEAAGATARPWYVAADARRVVIAPRYHGSYSNDAPGCCFGRLAGTSPGDTWATAISGATSSASALNSSPAAQVIYGLLVYLSAGQAAYVARGASGAAQSLECASLLRAKGNTGSSSYANVGAGAGAVLVAGPAVIAEGATTDLVPRGHMPGPLHLCHRLLIASAPAGTLIGSPGNGSVVMWANRAANAWLLDLGQDGRWD